ncbi:putative membrane protein [Chitinophaga skermanii]|uniref:Putative membrane protein n=1 Tax=Chitinophaga skermanii TaxID=331697 RepID=A0A327QJ92_9BACT|nr:bestrophin family ion channel [Chitinophaga skermanii]RAJ04048.1 putative membrane protein [Chitinophaga skermanii]
MLLRHRLSITQIFRLTWKVDLWILLCCTAAYYIDVYYMKSHISIPGSISGVLGTAIAFFVGFNNNQAYDRWWEARTIWGALVNDSRSFARSVLQYTEGDFNSQQIARRMVQRHLAFIYALKARLRSSNDDYYVRYLNARELAEVQDSSNVANAILQLQSRDLQQLEKEGSIDQFRFRAIDELLVKLTDAMGKSERIKTTVFPPSYSFFTSIFIWFYVIMNTLMMTETIGAWSILFGWAFGFVFHVTQLNGLSIMNPFEETQTGIALDSISRNIEINLLEAMHAPNIPEPVQPVKGLYIM